MPRSHLSPSRAHLPRRNTARISHCDRQDILRAACHAVWIELLEPRTLLAINAFINARILTVTSTAADVIQIFPTGGNGGTLTVDGNNGAQTFGPFDPDDYDGILVDAAGMNDRVTLMTNAQTAATSTMLGGAGNDTLIGDGGTTFFVGGTGNDYMEGMQGSDVYVFEPVAAMETDLIAEMEFAGEGVNVLTFAGLPGFAAAVGSAGADNVTINVSTQIPGFPDFIAQHNNRDIFAAAGFTPKGMHVLVGGWDDDDITGSSLANTLVGDLGDDDLNGLEENDVYLFEDADPLFPEDDTITEPAVNSGIDLVSFGGLTVIDTFNQNASVISFDAVTLADLGVDLTQVAPNLLSQDSNLSRQITSTTPGELENVLGGLGNDDITGNDLDNRLSGNFGEDEIEGNGGNDKLFGEFDVTPGVNRPGRLLGGTQDDTLSGSGGNDELWGGFGNDEMKGGAGDNVWVFENASGDEMDVVDADQAGNNKLDFSRVNQAGITIDLTKDTPNNIASHGGASSSRTVKTKAAGQAVNNINRAVGGTRGDTIIGNDLPNTLDGNNGGDNIRGGDEDDNLIGGDGDDTLNGDDGDDFLADQFGNNTFVFTSVNQGFEIDTIDQPVTPNSINTIDFSALPANDPVDIDLANDGAIAAHTGRTVTHFAAGQALALQIAIGGVGNDIIRGNSVSNTLVGNAGNDVIDGRASDDRINGGAGGDDMTGGDGNDTYIFADPVGIELDSLTELGTGNSGVADHLDFSGSTVAVIINLGSFLLARQGNRFLTTSLLQTGRIENATGGSGNDTITGNATSNRLAGGPGDDTYRFNKSNNPNDTDTLIELANQGNDTLDFSLLLANDPVTVNLTNGIAPVLAQHANRSVVVAMAGQAANFENAIGGAGNDTITGNDADNRLEGRAGNDSLDGRGGNDTAIGGIGNDSYRFTSAPGAFEGDTVSELPNEGIDTLDFAQLPANEPVDADLSLDNFLAIHGSRVVSTNAGESANFENLIGSPGDDMLKGNAAVNTLEGMDGDDMLQGRGGSDFYRYVNAGPFGSDMILEAAYCVDKDVIQFVNTAAFNIDLGSIAVQNVIGAGGNVLKVKLSSNTGVEDVTPRMRVGDTITNNGCAMLGNDDQVAQGSGPINNAPHVEIAAGPNPVVGGVETIAVDPGNANNIYIGSVNGGIWRTTNGGTMWKAQTDKLPSLSIGSIAFSPLTNTTLFAGTGGFSNGGIAGPNVGMYRTTDGMNWSQIGGATLNNRPIRRVMPTNIRNDGMLATGLAEQVVFAATNAGLFRSSDGGNTFAVVGPALNATDIVQDPGNRSRFFASFLNPPGGNNGVYISNDGGLTWATTNTVAADPLTVATPNAVNLELGIGRTGGTTAVFAAAVSNVQAAGEAAPGRPRLTGVFWTESNGAGWVNMGIPNPLGAVPNLSIHPGGQGINNLSIAVDPGDKDIVFIGGDRQTNFPFYGSVWRGDSTNNTWTSIVDGNTGNNANMTAPHADSRCIVFDGNGNILQGDDGGIYKLTNPSAAARAWTSLNGDLAITEFYTTAHDTLNDILIGPTQDNGVAEQSAANSATWNLNTTASPIGGGPLFTGDGSAADAGVMGATVDRYLMGNNFSTTFRITYNNANGQTALTRVNWRAAPGGAVLGALSTAANRNDTAGFFGFVPFAVNKINPLQLLAGRFGLYESVPDGLGMNGQGEVATNISPALVMFERYTALAYGGRQNNNNVARIIYAGTNAGRLLVRRAAGGLVNISGAYGAAGGNRVLDIAVDPENWQRAYVIDNMGAVFQTTDAGATFTNITVAGATNIQNLLNNTGQTIEVIPSCPGIDGDLIVVGGIGGVYARSLKSAAMPTWQRIDPAIPNAPINDLRYDNSRDSLIVGTFGRGAFKLNGIKQLIAPAICSVQIQNSAWVNAFRNYANNMVAIGDVSGLFAPVGNGNLQLSAYPWQGVDTISLRFTKNVSINQNSLMLNGQVAGAYGLAAVNPFVYPDPAAPAGTFTATWKFANVISADRLTLTLDADGPNAVRSNTPGFGMGAVLDGNWNNPVALNNVASSVFTSGDGMPGGNFVFNFNSLLGDANGNGAVTVADVNFIRAHQSATTAAPYDPRADINGDGKVDNADIALARGQVGQSLPGAPAPLIPEADFTTTAGESGPTRAASLASASIFADRKSIAAVVLDDSQDFVLVNVLPEV